MESELMAWIFGGSGILMSIIAIIKEIVEKKISENKTDEEEKRDMIETLLQMGCRTDLYQIYQFARQRGYRTEEETDLFNEFYDVYKTKYNGNSYAEEIRKRFFLLAQREEDES